MKRMEIIMSLVSIVGLVCLMVYLFHSARSDGTKPEPQAKADQTLPFGKLAVSPVKEGPSASEWMDELLGGAGGVDLPQVRDAAKVYTESHDPGCRAKGFSSTPLNGNLYIVAVDLTCGRTRKTVNLVERRFYTLDQKSSYWKADLPSKDVVVGLALTGEGWAEPSGDQ